MKKKIVLTMLVLSVLLSIHYSAGPASQVGQGYTGAPGEGGGLCGSCHSSGAYGVPTTLLEITDGAGMTVDAYTPGETYQISLTANAGSGAPDGYGFQLTILDNMDNDVAVFSNPSANTQISTAANVAGGRTYAEHDGTSATNNFTFDWVAPVGGTGELTFYYNVNLVNDDQGISGDSGGNGYSYAMSESIPTVKVLGALEINEAFTFPTVDGSADQVLTTNGAGEVSWMDAQAAFAGNNTSNQNYRIANNTHASGQYQNEEIDNLKTEIVYLKEEIEALKALLQKLTEERE